MRESWTIVLAAGFFTGRKARVLQFFHLLTYFGPAGITKFVSHVYGSHGRQLTMALTNASGRHLFVTLSGM